MLAKKLFVVTLLPGMSVIAFAMMLAGPGPHDVSPGSSPVATEPNRKADAKVDRGDTGVRGESKWYRGNLHTHSFWSDGNDFPEMIARWYADRGYHFLALTDHNILSRGEKWMSLDTILQRGGQPCLDKYREAFDEAWIETRTFEDKEQVRLKALAEFRGKFEKPGEFLLIEAEEISDAVDGKPLHLNASNLEALLSPTGGDSIREAMDANLRAAAEQAAKTGRQILVHLNHPNFGWAVTAEDLAAVTRERFFEVYNGHPSVRHLGDKDHPSVERMWDIINTLRLDKLDGPPLYGLATDDTHHYHGVQDSRPGRGWVVVRSPELTADELIKAMMRGDFYASSGVQLVDVQFDQSTKQLSIEIDAEEGVTYETRFIGTRHGYDQTTSPRTNDQGDEIRVTRVYSSDIGQVLATDNSLSPVYQLGGDEIYVRAVITSSKAAEDPSFEGQLQQAWTQPVGFEAQP